MMVMIRIIKTTITITMMMMMVILMMITILVLNCFDVVVLFKKIFDAFWTNNCICGFSCFGTKIMKLSDYLSPPPAPSTSAAVKDVKPLVKLF